MSNTLHLDLTAQRLTLLDGAQVMYSCPISSGAAGIGTEPGSGKTPTGRFRICAKIGHGEPIDTIFISRQAAGHYPTDIPHGMDENSDFILTRILWLDGLAPHNANTRSRYIYLHATNRTDLLGTPASHGCIRLSPQDMINVFDMVDEHTEVVIKA